jgi:hypothetical protein
LSSSQSLLSSGFSVSQLFGRAKQKPARAGRASSAISISSPELVGKDLRTHALSPKQVWVELLKQFLETGKTKRVGDIKPRLNDPAGIDLPLFYVFPAPNAGVLPAGTTNAILYSFVPQDLSDSKHVSHLRY